MNNYLLILLNGMSILAPTTGTTVQDVLSSWGVTDPSTYGEFDSADFDPACFNFSSAFTLANGVVGFDLDKAKQLADSIVNAQSNEAAKKTLEGLSYDVYVAQSSLPPEQRTAKYQAAIDANNAIALETEQREQAIYAATTIDEVNAIVYPQS
jgi:hypothetical protein